MKEDALPMFFVGTNASHIDGIIVMAKIFVVVCRATDGYLVLLRALPFKVLSLIEFGNNFRPAGREPFLHFFIRFNNITDIPLVFGNS